MSRPMFAGPADWRSSRNSTLSGSPLIMLARLGKKTRFLKQASIAIVVCSISWHIHHTGVLVYSAADKYVILAEDREQSPRLLTTSFFEFDHWQGDSDAVAGNWLSPPADKPERLLAPSSENVGSDIQHASRYTEISTVHLISKEHLEANFNAGAESNMATAIILSPLRNPYTPLVSAWEKSR